MQRVPGLPFRRVLAGVVAIALLAGNLSLAQQPPQLTHIIEAWKQREEQVRTAKLVWNEARTQAKGYVSTTIGRRAQKPGQTIPPEDTTFNVPSELILQEANFRYTFEDSQWSTGEEVKLIKQDTVAVQTQKSNLTVMPTRTNFGTWPIATLYGRPVNPHRDDVTLRPFWLAFRGISSALYAVELTEYAVQPRPVRLNGVECLELHRQLTDNRTERLWVAPSRGFAPLRQTQFDGNQIRFQMTIDYRNESGLWCPGRWEIISLDATGKRQFSVKGELKSAVINPTVTPADLEVTLPPGCAVHDLESKQDYIILPTGDKRFFANEDYGKPYAELVSTGLAAQQAGSFLWSPLVWVGGGGLVIGLVALWVLRRKGRGNAEGVA
jgi:hypothetical protein